MADAFSKHLSSFFGGKNDKKRSFQRREAIANHVTRPPSIDETAMMIIGISIEVSKAARPIKKEYSNMIIPYTWRQSTWVKKGVKSSQVQKWGGQPGSTRCLASTLSEGGGGREGRH